METNNHKEMNVDFDFVITMDWDSDVEVCDLILIILKFNNMQVNKNNESNLICYNTYKTFHYFISKWSIVETCLPFQCSMDNNTLLVHQ